jgi:hypothetical protein
MEELPEDEIEEAETTGSTDHVHGDLADDDALREHLRGVHHLEAPEHLSGPTLEGLHDRMHDETKASDQ